MVTNYEEYYKRLNEKDKKANIILELQNYILKMKKLELDEMSDLDSLLKIDLERNKSLTLKKDLLFSIAEDAKRPFEHISENMRANIIRENVMMPVEKVKEMNTQGFVWLSRQPGRSIQQKLSQLSSMKGVRRRMSVDTGENRLFVTFLRNISFLLMLKEDGNSNFLEIEKEFLGQIEEFLYSEEVEEIKRWENMPPNNTLLSDRNYRKIWNAYNDLKELDDNIKAYYEELEIRIARFYFLRILSELSKCFIFPNVPVKLNIEKYQISLLREKCFGIDLENRRVEVSQEKNKIYLNYQEKLVELEVSGDKIFFDKEEYDAYSHISTIELIIEKLKINKLPKIYIGREIDQQSFNKIAIDMFELYPSYSGDGGKIQKLENKLLVQDYFYEGKEYSLFLDFAKGIMVGESTLFSILNIVDNDNNVSEVKLFQKAIDLIRILKKYMLANEMIFIYPDAYNEFELSILRKASRIMYSRVKSFPRSIGVAFYCQQQENFIKKFKSNDFVLVVDLLKDRISYSLIQGIKLDQFIIWERHPVKTEYTAGMRTFKKYDFLGDEIVEKLAFFDEFTGKFIEKDSKLQKLNIDDRISKILETNKDIIGQSKVNILFLNEKLESTYSKDYLKRGVALEGYNHYAELQIRTDELLWREYLPELAIKQIYSSFTLIGKNKNKIKPEFGRAQKIEISEIFTLSKNVNEYKFDLICGNENKNNRFIASIKNNAFPLEKDVRCKLFLTYTYGEEQPYKLIFKPINKLGEKVPFRESKVIWKKREEFEISNLYPEVLKKPLKKEHLNKIKRKYDLFEMENYLINYKKSEIELKGKKDEKFFIAKAPINGEEVSVLFMEQEIEKIRSKNKEYIRTFSFNKYEGEISFNIEKRIRLILSSDWIDNGYGPAYYHETVIGGEPAVIEVFRNNFLDPKNFSYYLNEIEFRVEDRKKVNGYGRHIYRAYDITYVNRIYKNMYTAKNIRTGDNPTHKLYDAEMFFLTFQSFLNSNEKSVKKVLETKEFFEYLWWDLYDKVSDKKSKKRLFNLLSIMGEHLGERYYEEVLEIIYSDEPLNDSLKNLGCALGDGTTYYSKKIIEEVHNFDFLNRIRIFIKAIYANSSFINNLSMDDIEKLLSYFEECVKRLKKEKINEEKTSLYIEYILMTFTLRKLNDKNINRRLSLNNIIVQELYKIIENLIKGKIPIETHIELELKNKGIYRDIQDILYALLVYITGEKGESEIIISGMSD